VALLRLLKQRPNVFRQDGVNSALRIETALQPLPHRSPPQQRRAASAVRSPPSGGAAGLADGK
jgi:hypothetical protein